MCGFRGTSYAWDGGTAGTNPEDRTFSAPGTYTVTVTTPNGCSDTESIVITQDITVPIAAIANLTGTNELTCLTTSINVVASGGTTYAWDGGTAGTNPEDRTFSAPGTYTVTVTTANGCTDTESIVITQDITVPTAAIANLTGTNELTCLTTSINAVASGGSSYAWDGGTAGTNPEDRTFSAPGTYTVTVTTPNGCTDTESIVITQDITVPTAAIANLTGTNELTCLTTAINVVASGGTSYTWDGGTAGTNPEDRTFSAPGTYTVTVTTANGCTDTESIVITQDITVPTATIANLTGTNELTCLTTAINVVASGGTSYAWDGGTAGTNPEDRTFSAPGTYTVTVTTPNGCTDTESIVITQDITVPIAAITNLTGTNELTCLTTAINVVASGGTSYAWDGGTAGTNPEDRTFSAPGTYNVTVTTANGCSDTESIVITQDITVPIAAIANLTGTNELTCLTTSINVGGFRGTYAWDGGTAGTNPEDRTFSAPGTYTVTVTTANGCSDTESIVITQDITVPTAAIANLTGTNELTCLTTAINVVASGGTSYAWDGGTAGTNPEDRTFSAPGTYTVTVTTPNGCTDTESIVITQDITIPTAAIANLTGTNELTCLTTAINVVASGGTTYAWDGGTAGTNPEDRTFSAPGTYTVTVTTPNGCSDTESIVITQDITVPTAGIINLSGTTVLTVLNPVINVTATGGVSYIWNGGTYLNGENNSFTTSGMYVVTASAPNGCTHQASIIITHAPTLIIDNIISLPNVIVDVPVFAKGFTNIGSFHLKIEADQNISAFVGTFELHPLLAANGTLTSQFSSGILTIDWVLNPPITSGVSIPEGDAIFDLRLSFEQGIALLEFIENDCLLSLANPTQDPVTFTFINGSITEGSASTLNLEVFVEGLYLGSGLMRETSNGNTSQWGSGIADIITIELHDSFDYSIIHYTAYNVQLKTTGLVTINVPSYLVGSYYLTIKHRNSIETTSSVPVSFAGGMINYAFDAPAKAFSANLKQLTDGRYALFTGDVNQDGLIDAEDLIPVDNKASNQVSGYFPEDLNGDGTVTNLDIELLYQNTSSFIRKKLP
ncbi:MAG: hypothetical protein IPH45_14530 [Bacteroidales bacterium]|nr:hypothetical protein [Bacteroidales bacterium]